MNPNSKCKNHRISITNGMSGYFCILIADFEDCGWDSDIINSGLGRYETIDGALVEAKEWSEADGYPLDKNILHLYKKEVAVPFVWKDRQGIKHLVKDMDTEYLFFTLRMIWNHVVPEQYRIVPFNVYRFGSFYTKKYMGDAVKNISAELSKRTDLQPYFLECIQHINKCVDEFSKSNLRFLE